jgi:hypothetical protein
MNNPLSKRKSIITMYPVRELKKLVISFRNREYITAESGILD